MRTRFLEAGDGVRLTLHHRGGPAGAPPLLWGHANGFATACYAPLLDLLARDFDVWAWDARGQGLSAMPAGAPLDLGAIAGDAALALRAVQAATGVLPHVATHSFSGVAMLHGHATLDLDWRSATLFEPPLVLPEQVIEEIDRHHARVAGTLRRRAEWESPAALADRLAATPGFALMPPDALGVLAAGILAPRPGGGFTLRCAPATEAAIYGTVWDASVFQGLRPMARPMRFVASDGTPPPPPSPARRAQRGAAAACAAPFSELAGCSHLLALERPEACAALIRETAALG